MNNLEYKIIRSNRKSLGITNSVEPGKICVSDVENIKGIEFDIVFTITKEMTINEKYVAFTCPLSKLYIVD